MKVIRLSKEITYVASTRGSVYIGNEELVTAAALHEAETRGVSCNLYNKANSRLERKYELGGIPGGDKVPDAYANLDHLLSSKRYAGGFLDDPDNIDVSDPNPLRSVDEPVFGGFFAKTLYGFGPDIPEELVCEQGFLGNGVLMTAYVYMTPGETDLAEGDVLFQDNQGVTEIDYADGGWFWIAEPAGGISSGTRFYIPHKASIGTPGLIMNGTLTTC